MNKIKCPICKRMSGIHLETIQILPDQEYDGIDVFCSRCGKIGEVDIHIKVINVRIETPNFIKSDKERIRKELSDAHIDYIENYMGKI